MIRTVVTTCLCLILLRTVAMASGGSNLLTIDVRDVDISDVIAMLAAQAGINVVTDGSVKSERITLRLHDVTFDEALRAITSAHSLQVRAEGNILIVGAADAMNRRSTGVVRSEEHTSELQSP